MNHRVHVILHNADARADAQVDGGYCPMSYFLSKEPVLGSDTRFVREAGISFAQQIAGQ